MSDLHSKIVTLAKKRIPPTQIAKLVKCSQDKVYSEIRKARTRGEVIPYFKTAMTETSKRPGSSVVLPDRLHELLTLYEQTKELTPGEAATSLLEASLLSKAVSHG
ncbi:hypothetical protein GTA62_12955 [Roseobacter sp. HKCCD9010]|uniref:hypothetical protein n=1 Tax=unclassified Roseobacter TaxID=196798 RepID=UPI00149219F3|nr:MULTISPECIES: hypothetical protein [unclassified Roseobacter]MBF9049907.1 hypothetical protein [Rhodobacterales bacterium HKCCD4356]NNV13554.1 hypothetical protein [Roseobacter sp. HKCCD7357]NNV16388.1 hypothetical protein [Roseobacter sp. HKCCD8768]NNV25847.1 hypothetical protein [Roseobacter sp. HKCCD8192]NNV30105.1 hypothetical protein [Roseobacter sp. HKCCD9061]